MGKNKKRSLNKVIKNLRKKIGKLFIKGNKTKRKIKLVGFKLVEVIILVVIASVIGVSCGSFITYNYDFGVEAKHFTNDPTREFEEAYKNIIKNYYKNVDKDKLVDAAINGMMSTLDGYTSYMTPDEAKQFNENMEGEYKGIGIEFITEPGYKHTIVGVFAGSPAAKAGLKMDDTIIKVDDMNADALTGQEIANYIRGIGRSEVTVVIDRAGEKTEFVLKTQSVSLPSVQDELYNLNNKKVGYINISLFAENTADQFRKTLISLEEKNIDSLIIDVRNNNGGYLHTATNIVEMFLTKGDIVYQIAEKSKVTKYADKTKEKRTYPVLVLVNECTASASEVLAAAFKEIYGSQIVGITTYGKGTIQQPNELLSGGMIKITTGKWLTPKGNWIDKSGISPTVEVEIEEGNCAMPSFDNDIQLKKALDIITK